MPDKDPGILALQGKAKAWIHGAFLVLTILAALVFAVLEVIFLKHSEWPRVAAAISITVLALYPLGYEGISGVIGFNWTRVKILILNKLSAPELLSYLGAYPEEKHIFFNTTFVW